VGSRTSYHWVMSITYNPLLTGCCPFCSHGSFSYYHNPVLSCSLKSHWKGTFIAFALEGRASPGCALLFTFSSFQSLTLRSSTRPGVPPVDTHSIAKALINSFWNPLVAHNCHTEVHSRFPQESLLRWIPGFHPMHYFWHSRWSILAFLPSFQILLMPHWCGGHALKITAVQHAFFLLISCSTQVLIYILFL
jgi:hypothetical protein